MGVLESPGEAAAAAGQQEPGRIRSEQRVAYRRDCLSSSDRDPGMLGLLGVGDSIRIVRATAALAILSERNADRVTTVILSAGPLSQ